MSTNPIEQGIRTALNHYFHDLGEQSPNDMYSMVLRAVERPLLEMVMQRCGDNQSLAAQWLGINRNTLRRKLQEHQLLT